jgi:DNA-binding XRE family transcriptional regulator
LCSYVFSHAQVSPLRVDITVQLLLPSRRVLLEKRCHPPWHLVSEGATHNTRRVRMIESSRSTPLPALAAHRRRRGLTQRQLGELAGVAHTTVQQLESLRRGAYPQTMQKLATALRVEPKDLL